MTHKEIEKWLDQYGIKNYTIRPDGVVDVNEGIYLGGFSISILPIQFGRVVGRFDCAHSQLSSFKGFPETIDGDFFCHDTQIKSFSGVDKVIGQINGLFTCDDDATYLLGLLLIKGITTFYIDADATDKGPIHSIFNKYVGTGDILSAQDELIDAGFIDQARL
jgi:hypothetical protein